MEAGETPLSIKAAEKADPPSPSSADFSAKNPQGKLEGPAERGLYDDFPTQSRGTARGFSNAASASYTGSEPRAVTKQYHSGDVPSTARGSSGNPQADKTKTSRNKRSQKGGIRGSSRGRGGKGRGSHQASGSQLKLFADTGYGGTVTFTPLKESSPDPSKEQAEPDSGEASPPKPHSDSEEEEGEEPARIPAIAADDSLGKREPSEVLAEQTKLNRASMEARSTSASLDSFIESAAESRSSEYLYVPEADWLTGVRSLPLGAFPGAVMRIAGPRARSGGRSLMSFIGFYCLHRLAADYRPLANACFQALSKVSHPSVTAVALSIGSILGPLALGVRIIGIGGMLGRLTGVLHSAALVVRDSYSLVTRTAYVAVPKEILLEDARMAGVSFGHLEWFIHTCYVPGRIMDNGFAKSKIRARLEEVEGSSTKQEVDKMASRLAMAVATSRYVTELDQVFRNRSRLLGDTLTH